MIKKGLYATATLRWFDHQPMFIDGEWDYADNRAYLDLSLLKEDFVVQGVSFGIAARNVLDNRDPVGTQWLADAYRPRGAWVELRLSYSF